MVASFMGTAPKGTVTLKSLYNADLFQSLESAELFRQRCKRDYSAKCNYEILKFVEVTETVISERIESETRLLDPDL